MSAFKVLALGFVLLGVTNALPVTRNSGLTVSDQSLGSAPVYDPIALVERNVETGPVDDPPSIDGITGEEIADETDNESYEDRPRIVARGYYDSQGNYISSKSAGYKPPSSKKPSSGSQSGSQSDSQSRTPTVKLFLDTAKEFLKESGLDEKYFKSKPDLAKAAKYAWGPRK